ncbi:Glucose-6-phosphate isomerase [Mycena kentingensis (nom. inval.)]|nr:Glucose-6-phosphate isomerase [Mycena kentingensis (nom. inval.)]
MLEIGAKCSNSPCSEIDYLPILCPSCDSYFCRFHASIDAHSCPTPPSHVPREPTASPATPLQRCAASGCSKPALEAFISPDANDKARTPARCYCGQSFCAEHRHPKSHSCTTPNPASVPAPKNDAARALLAKNFPSTASGSPKSKPTASKLPADPAKALMIMRHRAVALDPKDKTCAQSERFIFQANGKVYWVRKTIGAGRAIDLLATQLSMSSSTQSLILRKPDDSVCVNDQTLSSQIPEGGTLTLCPTET